MSVPAQYQGLVNSAAAQLGIPAGVVAAQIELESGWNPQAVSPTGAQGLAQFEPGTWATYGSGSPFDPAAAFAAYVKYMGVLLRQEGNLQNALAAYNAGPGNIAAGQGYANTILSRAGTSGSLSGNPAAAVGGVSLGGTVLATPISTADASTETVNASGSGSTCAFAIGTKNKVLIFSLNFSVCIISKHEARAIIGAMAMAGGAVITMVGVAIVMQYALDKSGLSSAIHKASNGVISTAALAAVIPK